MSENSIYVSRDPRIYKYAYDMREVANDCVRCSNCKWVDPWEVKSKRFSRICPINTHFLADAYSSQGRMDIALAILDGQLDPDESPLLLDIIYTCDTCGACDAMCKRCGDREPLRMTLDLRARLVQEGQLLPQHMPILESLKKEDNTMMGKKSDRGRWAEGLDVKNLAREKAEILFHAGCLLSFNEKLWPTARKGIELLRRLELDVGIFGKDELCCGSRLYDMGYRSEFRKYAESNIEAWRTAGVRSVVTACADGWWGMEKLYPALGLKDIGVYHMVEYLEKLLQEGILRFSKEVPVTVTYHDPCHLGRRANDYVPGEPIEGIYDAPRYILERIPGVKLVEMERIREFAWCCGAGGGVSEAYPEHSLWTAGERIEEAVSTGAEAIVTSCPWCVENFSRAVEQKGENLQVFDIIDLIARAV